MKILFICTHNRCRSILAEAITNHISQAASESWVEARSAGSQPAGKVHPLSIKYLQEHGINTDTLNSQSWDDYQSWNPDVVITVCDSAANEPCPVWFGDCIQVHWGLQDPSKIANETSDDSTVSQAFHKTIAILTTRIQQLLKLPEEHRVGKALKQSLTKLESTDGPV